MARNTSGVTKRVEVWVRHTRDGGTAQVPVTKTVVAHRHSNGQFHGATNHASRGEVRV